MQVTVRRTVAAGTAVGLAAVGLVALAWPAPRASAQVASVAVVRVPHRQERTVQVAGLSASGPTVVLRQPVEDVQQWLTGSSGTMRVLPFDATVTRTVATRSVIFGVSSPDSDDSDTLTRYDVAAGTADSTVLSSGERFVNASDDAWVTYAGGRGVLVVHADGTATEVASGEVTPSSRSAMSGMTLVTEAVGDRDVAYLALYDLRAGTSEQLAVRSLGQGGELAVDGQRVAWAMEVDDTTMRVSTRAVSGGPVTSVDVTDFAGGLFLVDGAVGYVTTGGRAVLRPFDGGPTVTSEPAGVTDAVGEGATALVSVSGAPSVAGVHRLRADGTSTRLAQVDPVMAPITDVDLAAGVLYTSDLADRSVPRAKQLLARTVSGDPTPVLGAATVLAAGGRRDTGIAFSADRGIVREPVAGHAPFRFLDAGGASTVVEVPPGLLTPQISGPYAVLGRRVLRADGLLSLLLPNGQSPAIFGSRAVVHEGEGRVLRYDLTRPLSPRPWSAVTNPAVLRGAGCTGDGEYRCRVRVATGGNTVVWADLFDDGMDGKVTGRLVVHDLPSGERLRRTFEGDLGPLVAGVGVVAYVLRPEPDDSDRGTLYLLDPQDPSATPVPVATDEIVDVDVDGGLVTWRTAAGDAFVARAPFAGPQAPRLLGVLNTGFSPNGDGRSDTWRPEFDLSAQVTRAVLTVRTGGRVLWRSPVRATHGSIRGVEWDGRDRDGRVVPDGRYTWTLTGVGTDGVEVTDLDGTGPATGTVVVDRTAPRATVSVPAAVRRANGYPRQAVTWSATATGAAPAEAFDVRVRTVSVVKGRISYGPVRRWHSRTGRLGSTYPSTTYAPDFGVVRQFSVRAYDVAGNVSAWSPWRSSAISYDDRSFHRSKGWRTHKAYPAGRLYHGRDTRSGTPGATLTRPATWGSRIIIFGDRCPTCGRVRVYVDGTLVDTVGSYAAATSHRRTLFDRTFPRGRHTVKLVVVGTKGHPQVRIDGIAYLLP